MKSFGYWVFGKDMEKVNLETLHKNGVTDLFLNYYAFTAHGESKVKSFIKKAKTNNINVHIWVQCFYDGEWHNPKTWDLSAIKKEIKKYANMENVKGVHLDYLRYPGNAYKTNGGAEAITSFVKSVRKENPNTFLSCAVMPESNGKYYYGQDIEALGKIVDAILPMQYKGNYQGGTDWLKSTTKLFSSKATIWSGLQSYKSDDDTTTLSSTELLNDAKTCLDNGAKGIILFRYSLSPNVNFTSLQDKKTTTERISATNIKKMAEKVKAHVEKKKKIPATVKIDGKEYTYGQVAYILTHSINSMGKSAQVFKVKDAKTPTGDNVDEKLKQDDYKDTAKRIATFIKKNKQCPNYASTLKSKKKLRPKVFIYMYARAIVYYYEHNKTLPTKLRTLSSVFGNVTSKTAATTTTSKSDTKTDSNCKNPYTSTPHFLNQGSGYLGQTTPYRCGPHSLMQGFRKFGWDLSEATLADVAGTTTAGTDHAGLETAVAWVSKQKGVKLTSTWMNFSELGSNDTERYKAVGKIACKPNKFVLFHIGYEDSGEDTGDEVFGHYEMCDKFNVDTKYVRVLNSLGSREGNGYYGHLQDRSFSLQSHYISNISQKSVLVVTKED